MNDRESLIAQKQDILRKLTRAHRQLRAIHHSTTLHQRRERERLENEIEQLMAEEHRLRITIDRTK